ncbi:asparagine synthase (glutamine-hydrolyzing) [Actinoallomurus sp. NPDC052308]|uniref:asparagine synthase (glutamine-hydrolyzing) n=1 Tax=Actinoallomurus sp. NPDC052308 TaxID=3155530 RepID=UPI0034145ED6
MCGIAGWLDFGRDVGGQRPTLLAMTDTLAGRGIDDRGLWLDTHIGLGHTRTSIIDLAGGAQPLTVEEDGRPVAVIVYNGEVYNFKQLRSELTARGHRFRTRSDTEVVLRAYLEWDVACAERLEGIFAFAVWDIRRERLVLVRDRLGVKPLFYSRRPEGVIFGSEPKALLANPQVRPVVTADGLRELFSTAKQPGQAVYQDMAEVRPGHTLTVDRGGVVERRYWALEARPHTDDLDTTVREVRSLLEDIVLRELQSDVPLCTALSGGVDSSAVTAIASMWRWKLEGERVRTFVTTYNDYAEKFEPDDVRFSPDEPFAAEVARLVHADHIVIRLRPQELMDVDTRLAVLVAQDMPTALGDMDVSNYLTSREIKRHSTVAVAGEVADEIFGGYNWMYKPECVNADVFPWVVNETLQPGSPKGLGRALFDTGFMEKIDMNRYYADSFQQAVAEAPHQDGEDDLERRMRSIGYVTLTRWLPMLLDRGDRLSMAHGLELRVPYADHRLVEYLYNVPWSMKTFDGREKSILRAAVRDLVPASVLERTKSPWPVTQDPAYTEMLYDELSALVRDGASPVLPFTDLEAVRRTLEGGIAYDWASRMNIEMLLNFNRWLTHYDVDVVI